METGFLNFHDEEHFSDFSLSLDQQYNLPRESQNSLVHMIDNNFDYLESLEFDSNDAFWEAEQELNGDLAILPVSGVAGVIPRMENIKEDFAKVLTDWQEHIGYLQASEIEEDIDMVNLDMGLYSNSNSTNNLSENTLKSSEIIKSSFLNYKEPLKHSNKIICNSIKCNIDCFKTIHISESEECKKEIDILGLDSLDDTSSIIDFIHGRRQSTNNTQLKIHNIKTDKKKITSALKEEQLDTNNKLFPTVFSCVTNPESSKSNTKKLIKCKGKNFKYSYNNSKKTIDVKIENVKVSKKSNKNIQNEDLIHETSNSKNIPVITQKKPVLEAGDVKSLLEQFEASEEISFSSCISPTTKKLISSKFPVNESQVTLLKKFVDSHDLKMHQHMRDYYITNGNLQSNEKINGSVQLDHDYCSNSSLLSSNWSISSSKNTSKYKNEICRKEQQIILIKELDKKNYNGDCDRSGNHIQHVDDEVTVAVRTIWIDTGSKKDNGLESDSVRNTNEKKSPELNNSKCILHETIFKEAKELNETSQLTFLEKNKILNKSNVTSTPAYEMKIQSVLTTNIQLQKGFKTKSFDIPKTVQMVSVLKKPPSMSICQKNLGNKLKESIITTTNSLNDQVHNIIIEDIADVELSVNKHKKQPRRKLNLAEYRTRREQNRNNDNCTNSPIQPMVLVYIHHVSTNTKPKINSSDNFVFSEREIVSVLKPKSEIEDQECKLKQPTKDKGMQTIQTVFGMFYEENDDKEIRKERKEIMKSVVDKISPNNTVFVKKEKDKITNFKLSYNKNLENNVEIVKIDLLNEKQRNNKSNRVKHAQGRSHRNYRRTRALLSSSRSRSRSRNRRSSLNYDGENLNQPVNQSHNYSRYSQSQIRSYCRSRSRSRNRICSRSRNRNSNRNRSSSSNNSKNSSRSSSNSNNSSSSCRSRSRSHSHSHNCIDNQNCTFNHNFERERTENRSTDSSTSRSSSRAKSYIKHNVRRRRISHKRSSISSSSSWSLHSRSHSRSCSRSSHKYRLLSRSTSRSSSSRSKSSRYSYHSRCPYDKWHMKEKKKQVEERRVIYVGRLINGITKKELRKRFEIFGPVVDISIHFREQGHNYGFVTFAYKNDAYEAVEHGNDDASLPRYDLCFGGRRAFCKVKYADLDGVASNSLGGRNRSSIFKADKENTTFDLLLKEAQAKLRKRKV